MTGSSRKSRFSFRSLFGTTPPASFTQFAARFVERQDPDTGRHQSWDAESGTSGPEAALTGGRGHGGAGPGAKAVAREATDQSFHRQQRPSQDGPTLECPLCLLELDREFFPKLTQCNHRACWDCLKRYLRLQISEGRGNIACPECAESVHPNDIQNILNEDGSAMAKYEAFMLRRVLATDRDARWCPAPDCTFVVIANNCATCPKLKCQRPGCDTEFCYHCKQEWHPNITCDMARQQRQDNGSGLYSRGVFASTSSGGEGSGAGKLSEKEEMKNCPSCGMRIIKADDGSCNHMTCGICGKEFCWLCVKQITDLHYLSPSGCTFWGKKPWSRKKKILWQLGMLVGGPVGIVLIAGIAIPGIIIGIPVFVGKKVYAKCRGKSAVKRNAAVTLGVLSSMAFSPIVALIAVAIGVPILLAYVYGVVPLSLLRSGGCGVKASSSGVRLEFHEGPTLDEQLAGEREKVLDPRRERRSHRGSQGGLSQSASVSSQQQQQQHQVQHNWRTSRTNMSGTEDHVSIGMGDVDSMLSGRTQESGGSCAGIGGSGKVHTVTVHMEQDRSSQGSTKALAGSLLNYEPK